MADSSAGANLGRPKLQKLLSIWPLLPAIIFLVVLFVYPAVQLLGLSLQNAQGNISGAQFYRFFGSSLYFHILLITFKVSALTTGLCLLFGYPVAYLLATTTPRSRKFLLLFVILPFWSSALVRTFAWIILLGRNGPVNQTLVGLGIADTPLRIIYNTTGVLIGMTHVLMPMAIIVMYTVMQHIDPTLTKAGSTLGGRGGQVFWRIYFPLSLPGVAASGLLVFVTALGFFITPALLGSPAQTMITQVIIQQILETLNWRFGAAISLVLLVATLLALYLYEKIFGLTSDEISSLKANKESERVGPVMLALRQSGFRFIGALGAATDLLHELLDKVLRKWPTLASGFPRLILRLIVLLVLFYLMVPTLFVIPVSFTTNQFISWPPQTFGFQWYINYLSSSSWLSATLRSINIALATGAITVLIGVPAAIVLARTEFPGKRIVLGLILSPLIIPRIIVAVSLFYFLAPIGLIGSSTGLVLGHIVLALPFVVTTLLAVLKTYDERLDQAAATLGANKFNVLYRVTLPIIRAGIIAGFLFAFITSFDDLTLALFITGGLVSTLPKEMWDAAIINVSPMLSAVSTILLIALSAVIILAEIFRGRIALRSSPES